LGHQILALALGCDTFKMKFGHRGGNHPVLNLQNGKVMITSQNHGYAVDEKSLNSKIEITYKNINDETIEGFCCKNLNIDCVQFHPEAAPGPDDADFIFKKWISSVRKETLYA
jgi:carbamoyl-phosphate synthase small subunit